MSRRTRAVAVAVNAWRLTPGKRAAQRGELPVLRTEVVAPLADAVRLVHGDEADRLRRQPAIDDGAAFADQPLGRDVQQPVPPFARARPRTGAPLVRRSALL